MDNGLESNPALCVTWSSNVCSLTCLGHQGSTSVRDPCDKGSVPLPERAGKCLQFLGRVCSWSNNNVLGLHNPKMITQPGELPFVWSVPGARAVAGLVWNCTMCGSGSRLVEKQIFVLLGLC